MNKRFLSEALTRAEYDAYVETHGRTPTQGPLYSHKDGKPNHSRPSVEQANHNLTHDSASKVVDSLVEIVPINIERKEV